MPIFLLGVDTEGIGIGDRLSWVWHSDAYQNIIVIACLVAVGWLLRYAARQEHWRNAARQIRGNRLAMICLFILLGYLLIGVLDSIEWRDPLIRQTDQTLTRNETGAVVYKPRSLSFLDRLCAPFRERTEKTYSAPLATHLYAKTNVQTAEGRTVRDYPPLEYPRAHLLGTDKVGSDVFYRALKGVRTGLIIGGFTTLIAVPFAMLFGVIAGYFGGWVDDAVQYIYATAYFDSEYPPHRRFHAPFWTGVIQSLSYHGDQQLDGVVPYFARRNLETPRIGSTSKPLKRSVGGVDSLFSSILYRILCISC